jgi:hypothetical protein
MSNTEKNANQVMSSEISTQTERNAVKERKHRKGMFSGSSETNTLKEGGVK